MISLFLFFISISVFIFIFIGCGKTFPRPGYVTAHMRFCPARKDESDDGNGSDEESEDGEVKEFSCQDCGKAFTKMKSRASHMRHCPARNKNGNESEEGGNLLLIYI